MVSVSLLLPDSRLKGALSSTRPAPNQAEVRLGASRGGTPLPAKLVRSRRPGWLETTTRGRADDVRWCVCVHLRTVTCLSYLMRVKTGRMEGEGSWIIATHRHVAR